MFGLTEKDLKHILDGIKGFSEIEKAVIFGSRAMGNYKKGSDVDLMIYGKDITGKILYSLDNLLNEKLPLPYFFDVLQFEKISNEELMRHIREEGKEIFRRKNATGETKYTH
jgi:uncharacterized protein